MFHLSLTSTSTQFIYSPLHSPNNCFRFKILNLHPSNLLSFTLTVAFYVDPITNKNISSFTFLFHTSALKTKQYRVPNLLIGRLAKLKKVNTTKTE